MPPKCRFTRDDVVEAAFEVVRKNGLDALSARAIAGELDSSTMPIYSYLKSMNSLEEEIVRKAFDLLSSYQTTPRTGDMFLDMGAGYILFAKYEEPLFRYINAEKHRRLRNKHHEKNFKFLIRRLREYPLVRGLSEDEVRKFFLQGWIYSHGLADLINGSFFKSIDDEGIIELLTYTGRRYIEGYKAFSKTKKAAKRKPRVKQKGIR